MGASSSTGEQNNHLKGVPTRKNYVPISDPPQYDLKWCSTDSDITELEEERRQQLARLLTPNVSSDSRNQERLEDIVPKPTPPPGIPIVSSKEDSREKISRKPTLPSVVPSDSRSQERPSSIYRPTPSLVRRSTPIPSVPSKLSKQEPRLSIVYKPSPPPRHSEERPSFGKVLTPIPSIPSSQDPRHTFVYKPSPPPHVPSDPRYQESRQSFVRKPSPPVIPADPRIHSVATILEDEEYVDPSVNTIPEDTPEEQRTFEPEQTEPTPFAESIEEELIRVVNLGEEAEPEATLETDSVVYPKIHEESVGKPSFEIPPLSRVSEEQERVTEEEPAHPVKPAKKIPTIPSSVRSSTIESLKSICTRPELCKARNCQRQVSFSKKVSYCDSSNCPWKQSSQVTRPPYPYDNEDDDWDDGYDDCGCTDEEYDLTYDGFVHYNKVNRISESDESDEYSEVMPDYQRYSREQPEKDANHGKKPADSGNMRECCRPCYPNRTASLKHNNTHLGHGANSCRCAQGNPGSRHNSESYVAFRGQKNPAYSKSTPNHLDERDSYQNFRVCDNHRTRKNSPRPQPPPRKSPPRSYPPTHSFERRGGQDRPHIPLPPPPQQFRSEEPLVPPHQHSGQTKHRDSRTSRELSRDSATLEESTLDEDKEMYSHNTNRNYVSKQPYNRSYTPASKALKPYSYEESGGSCSTCSNNCTGYDHCPMHHACRCQCHCMSGDDNYCSQEQSDDQLSYCSDSSNSECMNLAYQRTGDYPELMDELENTLSHRNRLRVQKTMQRFEMLSRQNKNLEKPIFEDEESVRPYNMNMHMNNMHRENMKHDHRECRCQHCEEKHRRQNYSRSETLAKRANYQPTPFPRNSGYVEKVARYMDPNLNNRRDNNSRKKMDSGHDTPTTLTNSTGTWQMDARKNEWVKVDPEHQGNGQNQYDFENSYPPLPPRPISEHMYDRRNYCRERGPCSCPKCLRRR